MSEKEINRWNLANSVIAQCGNAAAEQAQVVERGPWHISEWNNGRIAIQSDDFTHDVALEISGDFGDPALKLAHAERISKILNASHLTQVDESGMTNEDIAIRIWNKIAVDWNDWSTLSGDEKENVICAVEETRSILRTAHLAVQQEEENKQ